MQGISVMADDFSVLETKRQVDWSTVYSLLSTRRLILLTIDECADDKGKLGTAKVRKGSGE